MLPPDRAFSSLLLRHGHGFACPDPVERAPGDPRTREVQQVVCSDGIALYFTRRPRRM